MADQKVSDLPSLNGADVDAADLLYIIDSSAGTAGSKKITVGQYQVAPYSAGTANGVVYLNGSNVVTTGSALVFDGTNLGVGTSSPGAKLEVASGKVLLSNAQSYAIKAAAGASCDVVSLTSGNVLQLGGGGATDSIQFWNQGLERMRLDASGNLGLGVTPSAWNSGGNLQLATGKNISAGTGIGLYGNGYFDGAWKYINTAGASGYAQSGGQHQWYTAPSGTAGNAITFTQAMTLGAYGDLGIGATSPGYPLHINKTFSVYGAYINNTSTTTSDYNVLLLTGASSGMPAMMVGAGGTAVPNAGVQGAGYVGTQNNTPLVFLTNDAARARITSGGDLLVGTTTLSAVGNSIFGSSVPGVIHQNNNAASNGFVFTSYRRSNVEIGSVSQNGTTAVLFNTTSDRRLKDNIVPAPSASDDIDAIQIVSHDWKAAPDEHVKYGVIAQDLHAVAPQAVLQGDDGDEIERTWGVDYSKLVPMLIKEIQSLRARVAALEAQ